MKTRALFLLIAIALAGSLGVHAQKAERAGLTFTVTRFDDPDPVGPGNLCVAAINAQIIDYRHAADCSLREAILTTNRTAEADLINVPPGVYTLSLTGPGEEEGPPTDIIYTDSIHIKGAGGIWTNGWVGDLDINADLTIRGGSSAETIIDGALLDRVFDTHANVTISGVTIRNGNADARPGGGIHNTAQLTLIDVVVIGNSAVDGAGIHNDSGATLFVRDSVVGANTAAGAGGGLYSATGAALTIANTTISGNTAGGDGGGLWNSGAADLRNVTLAENSAAVGGGVRNSGGTVRTANSIIALNTGTAGGPDCGGTLASAGYNLVQDTSGCTIDGNPTGNVTGQDPMLRPLSNNGGYALLADSPAIDSGNPAATTGGGSACELFDQRGLARPQGAGCDMGALEALLADLAVASAGPAGPTLPGGGLLYTIVVTNYGPADATGISLTDTLPAGVTFLSAETSQGSCEGDDGAIACELGALATGRSITIELQATVDPDTRGMLTNTVSVSAIETDLDVGNNSAAERAQVAAPADLSVIGAQSSISTTAGGDLTYDFVVANDGPVTATAVVLIVTLQGRMTLVAANTAQGSCTGSDDTVECDLGTLAVGARVEVEVQTAISASATGAMAALATVRGAEPDANPVNNLTTERADLRAEADLAVTAPVPPDPMEEDGRLTYNVTVTNTGPSDATNVSLTQTLPVGARFVSATAPGDACIESESWVICVLDRLPSGGTAEAVVVVSFESAGTLVSTVSVSGGETDPNSANDEVKVQVTVIPASGGFPFAAIIAIVVGIAAIAGGALVYLRREELLPRN